MLHIYNVWSGFYNVRSMGGTVFFSLLELGLLAWDTVEHRKLVEQKMKNASSV